MDKFLSKRTHDDKDGGISEQKKKRLQQYCSAWDDNILSMMNVITLENSPQFNQIFILMESLGLEEKLNIDETYSELFSGKGSEVSVV